MIVRGIAAITAAAVITMSALHGAAAATPPPTPETTTTRCSAANAPGRVQTRPDIDAESLNTARAMLTDLVNCDTKNLITRTIKDHTRLTFSLNKPAPFWTTPIRDGRYKALARAFTMTTPTRDGNDYVWPRVASTNGHKDTDAWNEAIRAGLVTAAEAEKSRSTGKEYPGWRIFIGLDGHVTAIIHGN
ncbi:hypothetical protein GZ178_06580 [Dermatophilus congolensis]|uniref:hypothetical protein n=4 Tax=Dermatophilus congolensis TaxID=1863 RepID=UPI001AAF23A7|nr:hypothetical protein [Dermatophilus congolensis]MBO3152118.1 hypothetical protein [Dermatophilus congolensis]MBO3163406.1 hypothetical protein [Dermatophilus congolensis]MBO3183723.1 hypothetical protein [Dermatophilus congolensis]MBO3217267.1 hypothetical protein [Dermatophilus congolensis]